MIEALSKRFELLDKARAARRKLLAQGVAFRLQASSGVLDAVGEPARHGFAGVDDFVGDVVARPREHADDFVAMRGEGRFEAVASFFEGEFDLFAFRAKRGSDAGASGADRLGEVSGGRRKLL